MGSIRGGAFTGGLGSSRLGDLRPEIRSVFSRLSVFVSACFDSGALVSLLGSGAFVSLFGSVLVSLLGSAFRSSFFSSLGGAGRDSVFGEAELVATRDVVVRIGARSSAVR